jgi:glycine hydroxymethyltransferase
MKFSKDTQIQNLIQKQEQLQKNQIDLIASESYAPQAVLNALGSVLGDKYAEGRPGKRYYPGNVLCDKIELLAQKRALNLFNLSSKQWHADTQGYSGAIANSEIYRALLRPGDVFLSLDLMSGGHLSHGSTVSITGKLYKAYHYIVDDSYHINYQQIEKLAKKYKPKLIVSGASAYPFKIDFKKIGAIAKKYNAYHLADISHYAGLISAGIYPSPFGYADVVMSTTHKSLFGPRSAIIWSRVELADTIDKTVFPGLQGGPHMHTIAGVAVGLRIAKKSKSYYKQVLKNARAFASELIQLGADVIGGGTESHLLLVNTRKFNLHGGEAERLLESVGILANRNMIQGDISVQKPSAIRIGTYAITQRGMKEKESKEIAQLIVGVLSKKISISEAKKIVQNLTKRFPIVR